MTEEEFRAKVEYEGGIHDALVYGLGADDLDDRESELWGAWSDLEAVFKEYDTAEQEVEGILQEIEGA